MYILNINLLKEGDVLLTSEKTITSKSIRGATFGDFSHAILYVGHGSYIHSDMQGVHSANIQRLLFDNASRVKVLRPKESNDATSASVYARSQIGKEYSIKEAVRTKIGLKNKKENKQFCSRLVAEAYEYAGRNVVKNPSYCSPEDINKSSFFYEIYEVAKIATDAEVEFAKSFNPLQKQAEITNTILSEARRITKNNIQTLEDLTMYVVANPGYAKSIVDVYEKSGYLTMWQYDIEQNPWRYSGELFLALPISRKQKLERAIFEAESAKKQYYLYLQNYQDYESFGTKESSPYIRMNLNLYKILITKMADRYEAAQYVIGNA